VIDLLMCQLADSEYCTLNSEAAVRIPSDISSADYAPLLCAGVTVFNGIRQMGITPGDIVAVQGLGGLGHLAVQYARKMGYRTVALSSSDKKRDFANKLGANDYVDGSKEDTAEALQKMGGASLVVITAPNPEIVSGLVNACAPLGKVLMLARKYHRLFVAKQVHANTIHSGRRRSCQYGGHDHQGYLRSRLAVWTRPR